MKSISTNELTSKTRLLVQQLQNGEAVALRHRGRRLAQIVPLQQANGVTSQDPLYDLHHLADQTAEPLTDQEMDAVIYGH